MSDLFVYGTLRDDLLRTALLGRDAPRETRAARADGWLAARVAGESYPALVRQDQAVAHGLLLNAPPRRAMTRLIAYEGEEYILGEIEIELLDEDQKSRGRRLAAVFLPTPRLARRTGPLLTPWSFKHWLATAAPAYRRRFSGGG